MAFGGDTSQWADTFPESLIPDVLQLILEGWDAIRPVQSDAREEPITRRLRESIRRAKNHRKLPFTVWPEASETDLSTGKEIGRIDLLFLHGHREDVYLSFECKRLYYDDGRGGFPANVSKYTGNDGMMCFVTEKYSRGLPHGGMIGYILNQSLENAREMIEKSMGVNSNPLCLQTDPPFTACVYFPNDPRVLESSHRINHRTMVLYHVLLPN